MPFIHIEMLEGRTSAQKKALVEEITASVVKHTGAPADHVHVIIQEMKGEHYAQGGEFKA